jgi:hypothetical protein
LATLKQKDTLSYPEDSARMIASQGAASHEIWVSGPLTQPVTYRTSRFEPVGGSSLDGSREALMPIDQRSGTRLQDAMKVVTVSVLTAMAIGATVLPLLFLVVGLAMAG